MATMSAAHPPLNVVAAALRTTTERLARELAAPDERAAALDEFEWRIARAVAAMQGCVVASARTRCAGRARGLAAVSARATGTVIGRHRQISACSQTIDAQARREGVALVALKGAALHARDLSAGERPMGDIDLLVRETTRSGDPSARRCGYAAAFTTQRHRVFQPRGRRPVAGELRARHG